MKFYLFIYLLAHAHALTQIVTNHIPCTYAVKEVMKKGGNVVDGAITAVLCEGVLGPQDTGIGGGFVGVFKIGKTLKMINAREVSPASLTSVDLMRYKKHGNAGVPGMIHGMDKLHKTYGKTAWKNLFEPVISLCKEGLPFRNYKHLFDLITYYGFYNLIDSQSSIIINKPLCRTLEKISKYGPDYFYTHIAKGIIRDLEGRSYLTEKDFKSYSSKFQEPSIGFYNNYKFISTTYPGPGKQLIKTITDILKNKTDFIGNIDKFYKNNYKERYQKYVNITGHHPVRRDLHNIHGTSNICVKHNNDGICITSTVNQYFGTRFYSPSTGVILNNQLNDLPGYYKILKPGTTPPTSASITLMLNKDKLTFLVGGTGGDRIPAGVLNVINYVLNEKMTLKSSIKMKRLYFFNNTLEIEKCFDFWNCNKQDLIVNKLLKKSKVKHPKLIKTVRYGYNTVTGIYNTESVCDPRRGGLGLRF